MKNTKVNGKKLLSLVAATMLMASPVISSAEGNEDNYGFTLVKQEMKVEGNDLNLEKYIAKLAKAYNYLKQFNGPEFEDYETLQPDLQIVYYMANRTYMSKETSDNLIASDVVYSEDYIKENVDRAFNLIYRINEFNERTIKYDYENGTMDINHLIDPSFLCFDEHDRKIISSMFNNYFEAYKNGRFENNDYIEVFKELTTLHAEEGKHNAFSSEAGAMWIEQVTVGRQAIQMLYDDLLDDYTIDELSEYYVREELEKEVPNFVLRDDVPSFDLNCMKPLEYEIFNIGELETFCYDLCNNNIYKLFGISDNLETENELENYADNEREANGNEEAPLGASEATEEDMSYGECVTKAKDYLLGYISYDHLESDLNCCVYLGNREYITEDEEDDLIKQGIVFKTELYTEEGMQNFAKAYSLINVILDYNQSVIQRDYREETMDINHLIDPSCLCMNAKDREIVHKLHVEYFEAYQAGRYDNEHFQNLKALVGKKILPVGPMWIANNIIFGDTEQMLRDDMTEDYQPKDRDKWFDKQELKAGQWIVRKDVEPKEDSSDELEREVHDFKDIFRVIYTEVNDDIFATFDVYCK